MSYEKIAKKNPELKIKEITEDAFRKYGKAVTGYDFSELLHYMGNISIPEQGNVYVARDEKMMEIEAAKAISRDFYGGQQIQIGYCNGKNSKMNALEYHKCSEMDIAVTDLVLLLGDIRDIVRNEYASDKIEAFYVPAGTACELYSTTLHFSPCRVTEEGFKSVIILTDGTNLPLLEKQEIKNEEDALLFLRNKWLIGHEGSVQVQEKNGWNGIKGNNIEVYF